MDILKHNGFPPIFCEWVWALLSTSTSLVLINGVPSDPIKHEHGIRQGEPLSLLLFDLSIDPINQTLQKANSQGHLHPLRGHAPIARTSLYADDAAVFVAPIKEDIHFLVSMLTFFG